MSDYRNEHDYRQDHILLMERMDMRLANMEKMTGAFLTLARDILREAREQRNATQTEKTESPRSDARENPF